MINQIHHILTIIENHAVISGAIPLIISASWGLLKFNEHIKDKRFESYHKLIDWLVNEQIHADKKIKLDRQIATVYELRNFPSYFEVSKRILRGLKEEWKDGNRRILDEIDLTIQYMDKKWICRLFSK